MNEGLDQRNQLAADRTVLSAERTYAAWVQLGLAALAAGIGAKKLLEGVIPEWMIIGTASLLVFFSSFCFAAAVWRSAMGWRSSAAATRAPITSSPFDSLEWFAGRRITRCFGQHLVRSNRR